MPGARKFKDLTIEQIEQIRLVSRSRKGKERAANGYIQVHIDLDIAPAACLLYIMKAWGFKSRREAVQVAIQHLAKQTRLGLQKIELGWDD